MIKIDLTQFARDRIWFGYGYSEYGGSITGLIPVAGWTALYNTWVPMQINKWEHRIYDVSVIRMPTRSAGARVRFI